MGGKQPLPGCAEGDCQFLSSHRTSKGLHRFQSSSRVSAEPEFNVTYYNVFRSFQERAPVPYSRFRERLDASATFYAGAGFAGAALPSILSQPGSTFQEFCSKKMLRIRASQQ